VRYFTELHQRCLPGLLWTLTCQHDRMHDPDRISLSFSVIRKQCPQRGVLGAEEEEEEEEESLDLRRPLIDARI